VNTTADDAVLDPDAEEPVIGAERVLYPAPEYDVLMVPVLD